MALEEGKRIVSVAVGMLCFPYSIGGGGSVVWLHGEAMIFRS